MLLILQRLLPRLLCMHPPTVTVVNDDGVNLNEATLQSVTATTNSVATPERGVDSVKVTEKGGDDEVSRQSHRARQHCPIAQKSALLPSHDYYTTWSFAEQPHYNMSKAALAPLTTVSMSESWPSPGANCSGQATMGRLAQLSRTRKGKQSAASTH